MNGTRPWRRSTVPIGRARHHSDVRIDQSSVGLSSRFLSSSLLLSPSFSHSPLHLDTVLPPSSPPPPLLSFSLSSSTSSFPLARPSSLPNERSDLRCLCSTLAESASRQLRVADCHGIVASKLDDLLSTPYTFRLNTFGLRTL